MDIQALDKEYIANTYGRFPLTIARGKGSLVWDEAGGRYIDLGTGIAVSSFGISDDSWADAVCAQVRTLTHTSNLYYTAPDVLLAKELCSRTGLKKVFFSNSGAEANECAIKVARKYSADKYGPGRHQIITLTGSFHGRTVTTLAATGQDSFHKDFLPPTEGFLYGQPKRESVEAPLQRGDVAAVLFEPVQGEGGVLPLEREFVSWLAQAAAEKDVLLLADEVQTGNGRSGALYAYMHYGILPDAVSTAKGLAGGLPLGATMLGEKLQNVLKPGDHGSTFGGNPVCCAGALNVLSRIDDSLLQEVREKSQWLVETLSAAKGIKSVSGLGLMLGLETEKPAREVIDQCMAKGVLVISAKQKVRLLPALNIPWELLKEAVQVLTEVCAE